uniref:Putative secreted protein n=1 Tax=Rhipicephalus microplus TaxID=6941 RepID=A0A6M2DB60_RHIMP
MSFVSILFYFMLNLLFFCKGHAIRMYSDWAAVSSVDLVNDNGRSMMSRMRLHVLSIHLCWQKVGHVHLFHIAIDWAV